MNKQILIIYEYDILYDILFELKNFLSFKITAKIINYAEQKKKSLSDLDINELKKLEPGLNKNVYKIFDLKYSLNLKKSYGGTSFDNIRKMIRKNRN